jgi:hypothetical protein
MIMNFTFKKTTLYIGVGVLLLVILGVVTFTLSKNAGVSQAKIESKKIIKNARLKANAGETRTLSSTGEYVVGEDIKAGTYTVKLDKIEYSGDEYGDNAYVMLTTNKGDYEQLYKGDSYHIKLKNNEKIELDDNWQPKSWSLVFIADK